MFRFLPVLLMPTLLLPAGQLLGADRHAPAPYKSGRSVVMAPNGMVAASQPLAAQVGIDILKQGGNAVDAAIAANAAIGLMEPMSCGIGGDLFVIYWDAKSKKLYGLHANGRMPLAATLKYFADKKLDDIPDAGPLSWSVPGCVDGWCTLHQKFGKLEMSKILQPSIDYAENGFPVSEVIAGYWSAAEPTLSRDADTAKVFLLGDDSHAPQPGEVFKNPALAQCYREIAKDGRDAFYKGRIAERLVAYSDKKGGLLRKEDLEQHASTWVDPVKTTYRGHDVWELPPPGQGIAVLQMLNILEGYDLKKLGPTSPELWHLLIESKKLAYADRAKFYADPEFAKVPVTELIGKPYADARRKLIQSQKVLTDLEAGDPKLGKADTIYLTVVDKDRNCVSLIQSNYYSFGSGLAPADLGFAIQNRGTLLALDENHANKLEPGKHPFHTIIPAMVTRDGKPLYCFGVMGGDMQPQGHVQVLLNLIDFGMNVQQAGEAPRLEHIGSATPTGNQGIKGGGIVRAEEGISPDIVKELIRRGHRVDWVKKNGGGYQCIMIDPLTGMLHGGSEPRKDGAAAGY